MANPFVHVELNTTDVDKAKAFYTKLFDWELRDMPMPSGMYTTIGVGEGTGGGLTKQMMPALRRHGYPTSMWPIFMRLRTRQSLWGRMFCWIPRKCRVSAGYPFLSIRPVRHWASGNLRWLDRRDSHDGSLHSASRRLLCSEGCRPSRHLD
jgi:catechol 2,3-dioxygenase-like lactoylglutathione lyase family enzyme